jgi:hypothetical protein
MDEEKKSEASCEEPERLGPYLLQEQVEQSHDSQEELYLATHETSGATVLVRKHAAEEGAAPGKDWRVRLDSSASGGYSAMEVEHTDWARDQDSQSAESLLLTVAGVREEALRMARVLSDTHEPRPRLSLGLALASAAAVAALLFSLVRLAFVPQPPDGPAPMTRVEPAPVSDEVPTATEKPAPFANGWLAEATPQEQPALALPLPSEPFKGQKRPPCSRYVQVELVGGCWVPHELKAPCPDELYEHKGKCYLPIFATKPPPQSLGP